MSYAEREIPKERLEKSVKTLDLDEGIRIDDDFGHVFINKTGKRYCVNISKNNKDEFFYKNDVDETMNYLNGILTQKSRIFLY